MFEKITESIQKVGRFSEQNLADFTDKLHLKTVPKDAVLLQKGQVCNAVYFVKSGSFRQYRINEENDELTLNLFLENDWVFDFESFMQQKPSKNSIAAFEETTVFELSITVLHELIAVSQAFLLLGTLLQVGARDSTYETLVSPEAKYRYLMHKKPQLLQKFPLKHIASYLRMTPETLSRVRKKMNEK